MKPIDIEVKLTRCELGQNIVPIISIFKKTIMLFQVCTKHLDPQHFILVNTCALGITIIIFSRLLA